MNSEVTGIILAGGENSRMGEDKAFIQFFGKPLIETIISKMSQLFKNILIITNKPSSYQKYGVKTHKDIFPKCGSLGGIYTALTVSKSEYNFVVACDMPFLNQGLIEHMAEGYNGYDAVIPEHEGMLQSLHAIYSRKCIDSIEKQLSSKNFKIMNIFDNFRTKVIPLEIVRKFDKRGQCFINVNTPQDYQKFKDWPIK